MTDNNREIEVKIAVDMEFDEAIAFIRAAFRDELIDSTRDASCDVYFHGRSETADFVRLRKERSGLSTVTVKHTDKEDSTDRVEINIATPDFAQASLFLSQVFGKKAGVVSKEYVTFTLANARADISVHHVECEHVYIEIETASIIALGVLTARLKGHAAAAGVELKRCESSLFEIYALRRPRKLSDL